MDVRLARACGVRIAFTGRAGGVSAPPYDTLNLGSHVDDDPRAVAENRALLVDALAHGFADADDASFAAADAGGRRADAAGACGEGARRADAPAAVSCIVPNQVHGTDGVVLGCGQDADAVQRLADEGADYVVVEQPNAAALLCFADCAPVVIVSPTGRFAVAHAGWRGAVAGIAGKAARHLATLDAAALGLGPQEAVLRDATAQGALSLGAHGHGACGNGAGEGAASLLGGCNAYIGPHIHSECFECGADVTARFADRFGQGALADASHVSLAEAVRIDLVRAGMDPARIVDSGVCTMCNAGEYFSYRASGGVCGRQAAAALRVPRRSEGAGSGGNDGRADAR